MRVLSQNLVKWKFAAGETEECLKNAREVTIPHTWNVEEGTEDYWGKGWYETVISVEEDWLKGSVCKREKSGRTSGFRIYAL